MTREDVVSARSAQIMSMGRPPKSTPRRYDRSGTTHGQGTTKRGGSGMTTKPARPFDYVSGRMTHTRRLPHTPPSERLAFFYHTSTQYMQAWTELQAACASRS